MSGLFISFEGIDGSGKSTQVKRLAQTLLSEGHKVVVTREPGGSAGGEEIRKLVLEGPPERWSAQTELLLFTAARRDHLERLIWPEVKAGNIVITDRFADSSRMYQGLRSGNLRTLVDQLHDLVIGCEPDLTILIDMDPDIGLARAKGRGGKEERFEDFGATLQHQMRNGFLQLADENPERFAVIDGTRDMDTIAQHIAQVTFDAIARHAITQKNSTS